MAPFPPPRLPPSILRPKLLVVLAIAIFVVVAFQYHQLPADHPTATQLRAGVNLTTASTPLQPLSTPSETNETSAVSWEQELFSHYALNIITTAKLHSRVKYLLDSWWERKYDPIIETLSDTTEQPANFTLPNLVDSECPSSYNFGLWCKNWVMMKRWREDPKYKDVKWFYRGMDDSYLHLENAVWLTKQYDHTKKTVIGEMLCHMSNRPYLDGGPGFFISRAVVFSPSALDNWNRTLSINQGPIYDDVIWGVFAYLENISLVHYPGISHTHMSHGSELYNYYIHQTGHPWPLSWRPVAYHQGSKFASILPEVNQRLHAIDYSKVVEKPYTPPTCYCLFNNVHRKCQWDEGLGPSCKWAVGNMTCIGPGPFPNHQ